MRIRFKALHARLVQVSSIIESLAGVVHPRPHADREARQRWGRDWDPSATSALEALPNLSQGADGHGRGEGPRTDVPEVCKTLETY